MNAPLAALRIDRRRPHVVGPDGVKRIVLGAAIGSRELSVAAHAASAKPLRLREIPTGCLLVVASSVRGALDEHAREVIAAAALIADDRTEVVVAIPGGCADDLAAFGADRVIALDTLDAATTTADEALCAVQALIASLQPRHILLPDRGADADLGRRLGARLARSGRKVATDIADLSDGLARRPSPAGRWDRQSRPALMLLARGVADARLPFAGRGEAQAAPTLAAVARAQVRSLDVESVPLTSMALEEADLILAAGNGVRDTALFDRLAAALGAATGASRVAVDDGRFARDKQIGATGRAVSASGYIAVGISGAVQHLQGIKDCRHVIAVNLDESAPIVKRASLTIVHDAQALMAALADLVGDVRR